MATALPQIPYTDFTGVDQNKSAIVKKASQEQLDAGKNRLAELGVNIVSEGPKQIAEAMLVQNGKKIKICIDSSKNREQLSGECQRGVLVADNSNKSMVDVLKQLENYKEEIVKKIFKKVESLDDYKKISDDDLEDFRMQLEDAIKDFDKEGVKDILEGYDFKSENIINIINLVPKKVHIFGVPKITTEELENLATMNFRDVIDKYIETGEIVPGFEVFKKDLEEIKAIIKDKEAIIERGEEADRRGEEADRRGEEYRRKGKKAEEIEKIINNLIKKMKKLKQNSGIA